MKIKQRERETGRDRSKERNRRVIEGKQKGNIIRNGKEKS